MLIWRGEVEMGGLSWDFLLNTKDWWSPFYILDDVLTELEYSRNPVFCCQESRSVFSGLFWTLIWRLIWLLLYFSVCHLPVLLPTLTNAIKGLSARNRKRLKKKKKSFPHLSLSPQTCFLGCHLSRCISFWVASGLPEQVIDGFQFKTDPICQQKNREKKRTAAKAWEGAAATPHKLRDFKRFLHKVASRVCLFVFYLSFHLQQRCCHWPALSSAAQNLWALLCTYRLLRAFVRQSPIRTDSPLGTFIIFLTFK